MNLRMLGNALLIPLVFLAAPSVNAEQPAMVNPKPQIEDLGNQRYRIGDIEIDKAAGSFTVSGQVLRHEPPIEFLVATKGGFKSYESVLEANANAFEFNLACILIGLDPENATAMEERTHNTPLNGDPVDVTVSWTSAGETVSVPAARLLLHGEPATAVQSDEWVYTGSIILPDGRYLPNETGTLLGVVHRGESVIEHRQGIGKGNYGSVLVNREILPPVGGEVKLTITKVTDHQDSTTTRGK